MTADRSEEKTRAEEEKETIISGTLEHEIEKARQDPARNLGKFLLLDELGRGGMGVVHRAWQTDLGRIVALKRLPEQASTELRRRFLREAQLASRLRHPNIVSVHEFGEDGGRAFFTMDYIEGRSYESVLRESPPERDRVLRDIETIARALHYAHEHGVIHRDIKPQNILIDGSGTPYLTDFGLARDVADETQLTVSGEILGTPSYMSPEQAAGKRDQVDRRSDIYALGGVLYLGLTGKPPLHADTVLALIQKIIHERPEPPGRIVPGLPPDVGAVAMKCLEKDPGLRYASSQALADDLARLRAGAGLRGTRRDLRSLIPVALGVALAAILIVLLLLPWRSPDPPPGPGEADPDVSSLFVRPPKAGDGHLRWEYDFAEPAQLLDWSVYRNEGGDAAAYQVSVENEGVLIRNAELLFQAPLQGNLSLEARIRILKQDAVQFGIYLGGYHWIIRDGPYMVFEDPGGREFHTMNRVEKPLKAGEVVDVSLRIAGGELTARISGETIGPVRITAPPRAVPPRVYGIRNTTLFLSKLVVEGTPRPDWTAREKIRRAARVRSESEEAQGSLIDYGREEKERLFEPWDGGTWTLEDGVFTGKAPADDRAKLVATRDFPFSILTMEYLVETGPYVRLYARAGTRSVVFWLPCDRLEFRRVEVLLLDEWISCIVDGHIVLLPEELGGRPESAPIFQIALRDTRARFRNVRMREILPTGKEIPWKGLYDAINLNLPDQYDGQVHGRGWDTPFVGDGELRSRESWRDVEIRLILEAQENTILRLGARGEYLDDAVRFPRAGFFYLHLVARGDTVTLDAGRTWHLAGKTSSGKGPFLLKVEAGRITLHALRVRPIE